MQTRSGYPPLPPPSVFLHLSALAYCRWCQQGSAGDPVLSAMSARPREKGKPHKSTGAKRGEGPELFPSKSCLAEWDRRIACAAASVSFARGFKPAPPVLIHPSYTPRRECMIRLNSSKGSLARQRWAGKTGSCGLRLSSFPRARKEDDRPPPGYRLSVSLIFNSFTPWGLACPQTHSWHIQMAPPFLPPGRSLSKISGYMTNFGSPT